MTITDLVFDFYGTLVDYDRGQSGNQYLDTHKLLADYGYELPHESVPPRA